MRLPRPRGRRRTAPPDPLAGVDPRDRAVIERAMPHTMTGAPRVQALVDAVRHLARHGVPGAFAECGVWRGGSLLAVALTLLEEGDTARELWGWDTFEGMTEPGEHDLSAHDPPARETWLRAQQAGEVPWDWLFDPETFDEDRVRALLLGSGYPADRVRLVRGDVLQTIPAQAPERLALLRLDTDWYESTRHELEHLWPRLSPGGVLLIDDYGHWQGARRAVDEFFGDRPPLLHRVDYSCRVVVKPHPG